MRFQFASYLVFLGISYAKKKTYIFSINAFNMIFVLFTIPTPFRRGKAYPGAKVDIFMALATMASYKVPSRLAL